MSRFRKLSHTVWHCQYHIIWVPKYRYRVLTGEVRESVWQMIHSICGYKKVVVQELNVQADHIHLIAEIPPKISISDFMGRVKGQTAIRVFKQFPNLRSRPCWGNHFWLRGYCVHTVGVNEEMIRKYVRYQEDRDRRDDQLNLGL